MQADSSKTQRGQNGVWQCDRTLVGFGINCSPWRNVEWREFVDQYRKPECPQARNKKSRLNVSQGSIETQVAVNAS